MSLLSLSFLFSYYDIIVVIMTSGPGGSFELFLFYFFLLCILLCNLQNRQTSNFQHHHQHHEVHMKFVSIVHQPPTPHICLSVCFSSPFNSCSVSGGLPPTPLAYIDTIENQTKILFLSHTHRNITPKFRRCLVVVHFCCNLILFPSFACLSDLDRLQS